MKLILSNRKPLAVALAAITAQFVLFKLFYPYPDFFSDSYSYIYAAYAHLQVSIWPIGYSWFLSIFHHLTHSDTALIAFQYFFFEVSALYFYFTILHFFSPGKPFRIILAILLFGNPLSLFLCNYVNSDPIFIALSLYWFTGLIWIVNEPRLYQVFSQAILLFLLFTVRNNAYVYPAVSCVAFGLSIQPWRIKLAGIIAGPLMILPFILHTRNAAQQMTGTAQFSFFTGWQIANNALYAYRHGHFDDTLLSSAETVKLNRLSKKFYKNVPPDFEDQIQEYVGNYFIREPISPLRSYLYQNYTWEGDAGFDSAWGKASAIYAKFGNRFLFRNPIPYIQYFVLPNTIHYLLPPLEKLAIYNTGRNEVDNLVQYWFDYSSPSIKVVSKTVQGNVLAFYPPLSMFVHIYWAGCWIWWLTNRGFRRRNPQRRRTLILLSFFIVLNFCFITAATAIVLRYQVFPILMVLTAGGLLSEASLETEAGGQSVSIENVRKKTSLIAKQKYLY